MKKEFVWAFVGCGWASSDMADTFIKTGRKIHGVYCRTTENAEKFAEKYGVMCVYKTADELFEDKEINALYIATPHHIHYDYIKKAVECGIHVLCEKAITVNEKQYDDVWSANSKDVKLAEAMTVYHMPLHRILSRRVISGEFGKTNLIQVNFGSTKPYDMENRFFSKKTAGGALLDIGVYALACAEMYTNKSIESVISDVQFAESGVDKSFGAVIKREDGQIETVTCSLCSKLPKKIIISCDKAYIEIENYSRADTAVIVYNDGRVEKVKDGESKNALIYEIENFENDIYLYQVHTKNVMHTVSVLKELWGLYYECED